MPLFVSGKKYKRLEDNYIESKDNYDKLLRAIIDRCGVDQWNSGVNFKDLTKDIQFTSKELIQLISLCHPDKHNDSIKSKELTQKLLRLRG